MQKCGSYALQQGGRGSGGEVMCGQREVPDTKHWVMAWLLHSKWIWRVDQWCPQVAAAGRVSSTGYCVRAVIGSTDH